jgi:hypothetical protein
MCPRFKTDASISTSCILANKEYLKQKGPMTSRIHSYVDILHDFDHGTGRQC